MNMENNHKDIITLSQSDEYFFKRGLSSYRKKELQKAAKYLEKAVQLNPAQGVYQCQLAVVYSDMTEYERSNGLLQHILDEIDSTLKECYFFMANNYAYLGLFEKAAEMALLYLQKDPEGDFANDAYDLMDLLQIEEEEEFDDSRGNDELIIMYDQAARFKEKKRYTDAKTLLQKIIADYPTYWPAQNELAHLLFLEGETEEALIQVENLLQEAHYLPAVCQLVVFYNELGREREAEETAELLKRVLPMDGEHIYYIADALFCISDYEEAFIFFQRYLVRSDYPEKEILFRAGIAAYHAKRYNQAGKWWRQASEQLHPGASELLYMWHNGNLTSQKLEAMLDKITV